MISRFLATADIVAVPTPPVAVTVSVARVVAAINGFLSQLLSTTQPSAQFRCRVVVCCCFYHGVVVSVSFPLPSRFVQAECRRSFRPRLFVTVSIEVKIGAVCITGLLSKFVPTELASSVHDSLSHLLKKPCSHRSYTTGRVVKAGTITTIERSSKSSPLTN